MASRHHQRRKAEHYPPPPSPPPPPPSDTHYDYLFKIILLGPSGSGKTSLLHHFLHSQPLILSSQTIGVEFATKIITIDAGGGGGGGAGISSLLPSERTTTLPHPRRIKLQLWDTAGTERFRSVSRSYYRGAAGALLVYDVRDRRSLLSAGEFLRDARALGSRGLSVIAVGNKVDVDVISDEEDDREVGGEEEGDHEEEEEEEEGGRSFNHSDAAFLSAGSHQSGWSDHGNDSYQEDGHDGSGYSTGQQQQQQQQRHPLLSPHGTSRAAEREVDTEAARAWTAEQRIPLSAETSALTGQGVEDAFLQLARTILARIDTGLVNPDDPNAGIQYGDVGAWAIDVYPGGGGGGGGARAGADAPSIKSGMTVDDAPSMVGYGGRRQRMLRMGGGGGSFKLGEWVGGGKCCS